MDFKFKFFFLFFNIVCLIVKDNFINDNLEEYFFLIYLFYFGDCIQVNYIVCGEREFIIFFLFYIVYVLKM